MRATDALGELRELVPGGLRDQSRGWRMACAATADFPSEDRIERLRETIVDLLVVIEIETILGGPKEVHIRQLTALLDWIDRNNPALTNQEVG